MTSSCSWVSNHFDSTLLCLPHNQVERPMILWFDEFHGAMGVYDRQIPYCNACLWLTIVLLLQLESRDLLPFNLAKQNLMLASLDCIGLNNLAGVGWLDLTSVTQAWHFNRHREDDLGVANITMVTMRDRLGPSMGEVSQAFHFSRVMLSIVDRKNSINATVPWGIKLKIPYSAVWADRFGVQIFTLLPKLMKTVKLNVASTHLCCSGLAW